MGRGISNEFVVWCKIRLVGIWMKRREEVDRTGRVKSEMLIEEQYKEGYFRGLENKILQ